MIKKGMKDWTGRPGFLFEHFLPCLEEELQADKEKADLTRPVLERILVIAENRARKIVQAGIQSKLCEMSNLNTGYSYDTPQGLTISANDFLGSIYRALTLHNGNLLGQPGHLGDMVQAGFARVTSYDENNSSSIVINEPLVLRVLENISATQNIMEQVELHLCKTYAVKLEVLAEYAIALQIIKHNGKKLGYFLADKWFRNIALSLIFLDDASKMRLLGAKIHAVVAGRFGDFGIDRASELLTWPNISQGRVILARTGQVLPDILFTARGPGIRFLVHVLIKTGKEALTPGKFINAIRSVSRTRFLEKSTKNLAEEIQQNWKGVMAAQEKEQFGHIRIIISWNGFTRGQHQAAIEFSKNNPHQPIFLVYPRSELDREHIYGAHCYDFLRSILAPPNKEGPDNSTKPAIERMQLDRQETSWAPRPNVLKKEKIKSEANNKGKGKKKENRNRQTKNQKRKGKITHTNK